MKKKINRKAKKKAVYPKIEIIRELKLNKRRKPYKKRKQTIAKQKRGPRGPYKKRNKAQISYLQLNAYTSKILALTQKLLCWSALAKMFNRADCSSVVSKLVVRSVDICFSVVLRLYRKR
ncbi:MAG: hypothetical protein IKL48_04845 [Elusimicrobiaceae bacterium]|nr:hypothetical protein [Alphaproteobacteria bacterium]MBR3603984.1 hypothetical protein [Elusimicrobiaceae bacterium]